MPSVVGVKENHLSKLLKAFDAKAFANYMHRIAEFTSQCGNQLLGIVTFVESSDHVGVVAVRFGFDFPVFVLLSHPICRLASVRKYVLGEGYYAVKMGLVPVFLVSLNKMTVLTLYGERLDRFIAQNSSLYKREIECVELEKATREVEYSSMNFILLNDANIRIANTAITSVCQKYFTFAYWSLPTTKAYSTSTHFLYRHEKITDMISVDKTIYLIEEIGRTQYVKIAENTVECKQAKIKGLCIDNGSYCLSSFSALIEKDTANKLVSLTKEDNGFVNGTVSVIQQDSGIFRILTSIAEYGDSFSQLFQSLIGIIALRLYEKGNSLSRVATTEELKKEVSLAMECLWKNLRLSNTLAEQISNLFEITLGLMYPVLVVQGKDVYYFHPLLLGLCQKWHLNLDDKERDDIIHMIRLLELASNGSFMRARLSDSAEYFSRKGVDKSEFIKDLLKVGRLIQTSNLLH